MSVAGLTLPDNIEIFKSVGESPNRVCGIELNMSCPNVPGKAQIGYDPEAMEEYLDALVPLLPSHHLYPNFTFGVKLPPYFDPTHFDRVASLLSRYQRLDSVTAINSPGHGLFIDTKANSSRIAPNGGLGGLGGRCCLPIALGNVRQHFIRLAPYCKKVIGCGGVSNGETMYQHMLCGASSVQVGTQLCEEGPGCFSRILDEFTNLCEKKGYEDVSAFRGGFND
jgi:dihydroorotate dehydrogenase (fumarate)